jgi:hypothetical protein
LSQAFINGLPAEIDPEIWEPIVQNHFVSAGSALVLNSSSALMVSIAVGSDVQLVVILLLQQVLQYALSEEQKVIPQLMLGK